MITHQLEIHLVGFSFFHCSFQDVFIVKPIMLKKRGLYHILFYIWTLPAILVNITQFSFASFNITESEFSQIRLNWEMLIYFYDRTFKLYKCEYFETVSNKCLWRLHVSLFTWKGLCSKTYFISPMLRQWQNPSLIRYCIYLSKFE